MMDGCFESVPHLVHDKKCSFWKNLPCFGIRKNRVNQFLDSNAWRVLGPNGRHDCSFVAVKSSNGDMFLSSHPPLTCALHLINTRKLGKNSNKTINCQIVLWRLKIEMNKKNNLFIPALACVLHPSTATTFWKNFGKSNKLQFFVEVFQSEQNQITSHLNPQCPTHALTLPPALVLSRSFERLITGQPFM